MALREEYRPAKTLSSVVPSQNLHGLYNGTAGSTADGRAATSQPGRLCTEDAVKLYGMLCRDSWNGIEDSGKRKRRAARIARDSSLGMLVHDTEAQVKSVIAAMERIAPASDDTKKKAVQLVQELWARGLNFKQMMSELRTMYITEMRTLHPSMAKNHLASLVAWNAICDVYVGSQHSVSKAVDASIESFIKAGNYSEAILTAIEFNMPLDRWRSSVVGPKDPCCVSALIEKSGSKTAMARLSYNTYMVLVQALAGKNLSGGTEIERHRAAAMALTASDIADRYGMGRDSFIEAASTSMYLFNSLEHPARDIADILYMRCIRA